MKHAGDQNLAQTQEELNQELQALADLEAHYESVTRENRGLKSNLQACESNLQSFVSDMNGLLD